MDIKNIRLCTNNCFIPEIERNELNKNYKYGYGVVCSTSDDLIKKLNNQAYDKLFDDGEFKIKIWWLDNKCELYEEILVKLRDYIKKYQLKIDIFDYNTHGQHCVPTFDETRSNELKKIYSSDKSRNYNLAVKIGNEILINTFWI